MANAIINYAVAAAAAAAVLHLVCLIYAMAMSDQDSGNRRAVYELYKPFFVANSTLTTNIERELVQSCPFPNLTLMTMQADFTVNATTYRISGAFIAAQMPLFGFVHLNGYHLLFVIFSISLWAQVNVLLEYNWACSNNNFDFFEQPCAARWLEYALTSPAMITVIAACLAIRDMHTILLLAAAQGALVQFGFSMECAYSLRVYENPYEISDDDADAPDAAVAFLDNTEQHDDDKDGHENEGALTVVKHNGASAVKTARLVTLLPLPLIPFLRKSAKVSHLLWYWSFMPSTLLHVLVWGILLSSFKDQTNTRCSETQPATPDWLVGLVLAQAAFFSLFMVVAVVQAFFLDVLLFRSRTHVSDNTVRVTFRWAFLAYTILSALAKSILGITYLAYVTQFPFYTPA